MTTLAVLLAGAVVGAGATALVMKRSSVAVEPAATGGAAAVAGNPAAAAPAAGAASAPGEATIRAAIASRIPDFPKIDEVTESPVPGVYELRFGTDILYADGRGTYLFEGSLIDTATRANLTAQRVEKLTAIDFAALNKADAIVWKSGTGARQVAVFADPNCGYCKRFERELTDAKDVTVYTYLIPILGPDSDAKTRNLWCSKDRTAAWRGWMVDGKAPAAAPATCDMAAIERNLALARKHRVNGTPALVFEDGKRVPGAMPLQQFEQQLAASTRKS
jgi:thiol:disulfide interchange protein DsbC